MGGFKLAQNRATWESSLLQNHLVVCFFLRRDQCLRVAPQVAPAQQVQSHFTPQCAFVGCAAGAAVARAEPDRFAVGPGYVGAIKRGAADAGSAFGARQDDL